MEILKFNVDQDRRNLVSNKQEFKVDFEKSPSWLQARQYENQMRQVQVRVVHGDNSPFDLTDVTPMLEGWMPDGIHRIIDNKHGVLLDPQNGVFRFDFPAPVFAVAGSYKQIFFRLWRHGKNIATLEFSMEVLADKVIDGLIPADYVTPFIDQYNKLESIVKNAKGDLTTALSEWTTKLQDLFNKLNGQGINVGTLLTTLEAKIKADGLFTQGEASNFKQSVMDQVQQMQDDFNAEYNGINATVFKAYALDQNTGYGETMPDYFKTSFNHVLQVPHGDQIINLTVITDAHWQEDGGLYGGYAHKSLEHYQWAALSTLYNKPEALIANGDNVNGDEPRSQLIYTTKHVKSMLETKDVDTAMFMLRGNHDSGVGQYSQKAADTLTLADLKAAYGTKYNAYDEIRDGDSLYFYKDFPAKKVRLIGLDSNDLPATVDANGNYKYTPNTAAFRADQLNWLANQALMLPDSTWQVILFFHIPFPNAFSQWVADKSFKNYQHAIAIINAFKNGSTVSINDVSDPDFAISGLAADYTQQGKGTVIAVVNGHLHRDKQDTNVLNGTPIIATDCSLHFHDRANISQYDNTANEDCWETMSIDTKARTIHCYRFGRGQDRSFNY